MSKMMRAVLSMAAAFGTLAPVCADPLPQYSFTAIGAFRGTDLNNNGQVAGSEFGGGLVWDSVAGLRQLGAGTVVNSINDSGVAVGQSADFATIWDAQGVRTTIDRQSPGALFSNATRINNAGQILLLEVGGPGNRFYRKTGSLVEQLTEATALMDINSQGDIVGGTASSGTAVWEANSTVAFPLEQFGLSNAQAINDGGTVGGVTSDELPVRLVRDSAGGYTREFLPLPQLNADRIDNLRINSNGDIVGLLLDLSTDSRQSVLWPAGGGVVDLGVLAAAAGFQSFEVDDINDSGWILGTGVINGMTQALLLKPVVVPEPGFYLSLALGLGGLFVARRRRETR
jgi:hypothetical protein